MELGKGLLRRFGGIALCLRKRLLGGSGFGKRLVPLERWEKRRGVLT